MDKIYKKQKELLDNVKKKFDSFPKSNSVDKIEQLKDNLNNLSNDYASIGNQAAREFVDFLNSKECDNLSIQGKERFNEEFREKLKEILITFPKNYLTK